MIHTKSSTVEKKSINNWYILLYAACFFVFSINIIPRDFVLILIIAIFSFSPMSIAPQLYFFSLPWAYVGKFTFGITLSLAQSVIYVIRILIQKRHIRIKRSELVLLGFLAVSGLIGFIRNKTLTEISFVFYFIIVAHFHAEFMDNETNNTSFVEEALFAITLSMFIATIYGLVNDTSNARWISGVGYSNQLYGTLGTSRFGYYLCISLIYPMFYVHSKWIKIALAVLISIGVLATISMTAFLLLLFVYAYYFISTNKNPLKVVAIIIVLSAVVGLVVLNWDSISNIPIIKPVTARINITINNMSRGDYNSATSGRVSLTDEYLNIFNESSLIDKFIGSHSIKGEVSLYSHNSYIDMLNCIGILGVFIIVRYQIIRMRQYTKLKDARELFLLKLITLLAAGSVSIFSAQYWQLFLYL